MEILQAGPWTTELDPQGAFIVRLEKEGRDIFFPRQTLFYGDQEKVRGGCHLCLPQFGAPGELGKQMDPPLGQHGFGRALLWEVTERRKDRLVLQMPRVPGTYAGLQAKLTVASGEIWSLELVVKNLGDWDLPISPAFHPYFRMGEGHSAAKASAADPIALGQMESGQDEAGALFLDGIPIDRTDPRYLETAFQKTPREIRTDAYRLELATENLPLCALWSDREAFFCVEPTQDGTAFLRGNPDLLAPGQEKHFSMSLS